MKVYRIFYILTFIIVSIFTFTPVVTSANSFQGKKVVEVEYRGLIQTDLLSVKSVVSTKPKTSFSQEKLDKDIKALYNLEYFEDIKVDVKEYQDGVLVTFIFDERPTIREIIVKGNKKVSDITIKDEILLKKGDIFNEQKIRDDIQSIIDLYSDKGFPHTSVEYEIKDGEEKQKKTKEVKKVVDITFFIDESKRRIIRTINFSGVNVLKEEKLRFSMKTKERGYWFSSGYFREDQFEEDKRQILRNYAEKGYIDAEIVKVDKNIYLNKEKNREEMEITIYLNEGNQYTFKNVNISGNKVFTDQELYSLIKLKKGSIFNKTEWEKSVQSIRNLLADNGYIYYNMEIKEHKVKENQTIAYDIYLEENNRAHIENIFITGNEKTKKFVIAREIEVKEGEVFNAHKIQRSREKLYNLQYFSAVNIDVKPGSELGLVDLIFNVEEQRTGLFSFGLSYSTAGYGVSLFEEVSARNFLGRGIKLYEKVDIGLIHQEVEIGIDEPWLFNTPNSAGISLSWERTEYGTDDNIYTYNDENTITEGPSTGVELPDGVTYTYDETTQTYEYDYPEADDFFMEYVHQNYEIAFRFGRRFLKYYGVNSELGFSIFKNTPQSEDIPFSSSLRDQYEEGWPWYWKNYLSLTAYRDTRDLTIFATRGTYISQNIAFYGGPLGGYSNFLRLVSDMNINVRTFWKFVLSTRLNMGVIYPWLGEPLTIDDSDYLRVDCMNEGRGWQNPSQFPTLYSLRGRSEINFSLEHRFPIEERFLWGLTFFDISGIYSTPQDFRINFKDYYYSFGLGMSFVIPGFPIRLYLARRFKYNDTTDKWEFAGNQHLFRDWDLVFAVAGYF